MSIFSSSSQFLSLWGYVLAYLKWPTWWTGTLLCCKQWVYLPQGSQSIFSALSGAWGDGKGSRSVCCCCRGRLEGQLPTFQIPFNRSPPYLPRSSSFAGSVAGLCWKVSCMACGFLQWSSNPLVCSVRSVQSHWQDMLVSRDPGNVCFAWISVMFWCTPKTVCLLRW